MLALYDVGGGAHGAKIQRQDDVGVRPAQHGTAVTGDVKGVAVGLAFRAETRVEGLRCGRAREHAHVVGEKGVDGKGDLLRGDGGLGVEMHHLPFGVYARVRPAARGRLRGRAESLGESLFQHFLHAQPVELTLPADIAAAEIGDDRAVSHTKPPKMRESIAPPK